MRGLIAVVLCLVLTITTAEKKIICYYGSWAVYRPGLGQFDIQHINPSLCTHLIYTFVGLTGIDVTNIDPWRDLPDNWGKDGFGRFNALREQNPSVKTLLAIGGWNEGSEKYSGMVSTAASRRAFVNSAVNFVKKWKFNGLDFDWEYPAQRGGDPSDVDNYIELLKLLRSRFDDEGLILSAAVAAPKSSASKSYRISEVSKYLDFMNLMAYDFHGAWEKKTGLNAPLYPSATEEEQFLGWNVEESVKYWLNQGAPKEKINLGMPFYGHSFTLEDPQSNGIGAPAQGPGKSGPYLRENGTLGYNEICEQYMEGGWSVFFDEEQHVPYAFKGNQWVGFDNAKSIREKAELAKKYDLGGAMIWSIESDDFRGVCGEAYALLKTVNAVLRDHLSQPDENPEPPAEIPPESEVSSNSCTYQGIKEKPGSCDFIICTSNGNGGFISHDYSCGPNLCFNPDIMACDWKKSNHHHHVPNIRK